jgi:hypothetical protein
MKRTPLTPEQLVEAIAAAVDDGFCPLSDLAPRFPRAGRRDLVRAAKRAAARGWVIERRAAAGAIHLALTSEGWRALRATGSAD